MRGTAAMASSSRGVRSSGNRCAGRHASRAVATPARAPTASPSRRSRRHSRNMTGGRTSTVIQRVDSGAPLRCIAAMPLPPIIISDADVETKLTPALLLGAVEDALAGLATGATLNVGKVSVTLDDHDGTRT